MVFTECHHDNSMPPDNVVHEAQLEARARLEMLEDGDGLRWMMNIYRTGMKNGSVRWISGQDRALQIRLTMYAHMH